MTSVGVSQSGGILGGDGDFQRIDLESRFYAPLGQMGGAGGGQPIKFVLGMTARSGFVFGYTPFFDQLFAMGGTQFGIPLRGYDEFSITPYGYDPLSTTTGAAPTSFGKSFLLLTSEVGLRISQMFYVNSFVDAGNLWAKATSFDPNRLFRGAGFGLQVISPLGPLGIDVAYGFDKVPPGWKVHFRLGNFF
jgi:outer membrane protein insertion porin family